MKTLQITPEEAAAELLRRRKARSSLADYIEYVSGLPLPPHGKLICQKLEEVERGEIDRLLIACPPGHLKSTICSHYGPAWVLSRNKGMNYIGASHTQDFSDSWGKKVRNIFSTQEHQRVFPGIGIVDDNRAAGRWAATNDSEYYAAGVDATVTGKRANWVTIDDPLKGLEEAENQNVRDKIWEWYSTDLYTRLKKKAKIVLIATRWNLDDLSGRLLTNSLSGSGDKWHTLILPAIAEKNDPMGRRIGQPLWPSEYGLDELNRRKNKSGMTARMWSALYQQNPVPDSGGIIDRRWFKYYSAPEPPKLKFVIQSWDTALTANDHSAFSACTTWGVFDDEHGVPNLILLSAWRDRLEWPELRRVIVRMGMDYRDDKLKLPIRPDGKHKPDMMLVEAKANGQALILDLNRAGLSGTPFNPDKFGDKIARVRLITDLLENGRVWLPTMRNQPTTLRPWAEEFAQQASVFPASESRDYVDCMTMTLLRIKQSGWVVNTEDGLPPPRYTNAGQQAALY